MATVHFKLLPKFPKTAGTAKEFADWDKHLEETYPKRFKLNGIVDKIVWKVWRGPAWRLRNLKYAIMYRVHPKHKYNTIVIGKPDYYEPFTQILYAPFVVFEKFMDRIYAGDSWVQWQFTDEDLQHAGITPEYIEEKNARWDEMDAIYKWWKARPNREAVLDKTIPIPSLPKEWGFMGMLNEDYRDTPEVQAMREAFDKRRVVEAGYDDEDEQMLCRLAKLRLDLWD